MPALRSSTMFLEVASEDSITRSASSLTMSWSPLASSRRGYQRTRLPMAARTVGGGSAGETEPTIHTLSERAVAVFGFWNFLFFDRLIDKKGR
jgi:hypothetical protein